MIRGLLFDLDGVLVNTNPLHCQAWKELAQELGIRPEFLSITGGGNVECEIYGAMPTGMESTVKVRIGEYLLTGVVFGSTLFTIGSKLPLEITGSNVMLFDRSSGHRITSGTLKLL